VFFLFFVAPFAQFVLGDAVGSESTHAKSHSLAARAADHVGAMLASKHRARSLRALGRLDEAVRAAEAAAHAARERDDERASIDIGGELGELHAARGDHARAARAHATRAAACRKLLVRPPLDAPVARAYAAALEALAAAHGALGEPHFAYVRHLVRSPQK